MGFNIIETNKGYTYKNKKYRWGEGLIEFVNTDFSDFIKLIDKIDLDYYNKMESTNFTNNKTYIKKFYTRILNYNSNSLHINLLKDYLVEFFDIYDPIDEIDMSVKDVLDLKQNISTEKVKLKKHKIDDLLYDLQWNFKNPIIIKQSDYRIILKDYSINKNNLSENSLFKLEHYISKENDFPYMKKRLNKIKKNGNIEYQTVFYTIEEFCKYEFFKVLENNINIMQCPHCNKYFIREHASKQYCSKQCQEQFNSIKAKNDPYRDTYHSKTKSISNYCYYYSIKGKKRKEIMQPFQEIFNKYKQPIGTPLNKDTFQNFNKELDKKIAEFNKQFE